MSNGYNHQSIQHHHHFQHRNIFLPILCRLSLKDVNLNNHTRNRIPTDEPSSPKVSCIGQVKRNNRVIGYPTTTTAAAAAAAGATHHQKYTKLRKIFSGKTLLPPAPNVPPTTGAAASAAAVSIGRSGSRSCRSSKDLRAADSRRLRLKNEGDRVINRDDRDCVKVVVVNIGEMDPPLPVVKKVAPPGIGRDEVNIWKRRFNGTTGLEGLQIEQIHLPNCKFQPPTV